MDVTPTQLYDFQRCQVMARAKHIDRLASSLPDRDEKHEFLRGNVAHTIMEALGLHSENSPVTDEAMSQAAKYAQSRHTEVDVATLNEVVTAVYAFVSEFPFKTVDGGIVSVEHDWKLRLGKHCVYGRADRVDSYSGGASISVIDYKYQGGYMTSSALWEDPQSALTLLAYHETYPFAEELDFRRISIKRGDTAMITWTPEFDREAREWATNLIDEFEQSGNRAMPGQHCLQCPPKTYGACKPRKRLLASVEQGARELAYSSLPEKELIASYDDLRTKREVVKNELELCASVLRERCLAEGTMIVALPNGREQVARLTSSADRRAPSDAFRVDALVRVGGMDPEQAETCLGVNDKAFNALVKSLPPASRKEVLEEIRKHSKTVDTDYRICVTERKAKP